MPDRERVIKGIQIERECVSRDCDRDCGKCDLVQDREWLLEVYDEALELLKEQPTIVQCKDCKHRDPEDGKCDSGHDIYWNLSRPDDWFCADGERK